VTLGPRAAFVSDGEAIEGNEITEDFCRPTAVQDLYDNPPVTESDQATRFDRIIDRTSIWKEFRAAGRQKLSATNGLTIEENEELFHTPVLDQVIELVLIGLSRLPPGFVPQR
jgi:hypothetical protein